MEAEMSQDATMKAPLPALPGGSMSLEGVMTGGQPTAEQLEELAASGFRTVVDLRTAAEPRGFDEAEAVRAAGMEYIHLPVGMEIGDHVISALRRVLGDEVRRPVLVHCVSGNRVGGAILPHLVLDRKMGREEAIQLAIEIGLRSRELASEAEHYIRHND
jgi:uncharacterized protein (TIGR01244 family)